MSFENKGSIAAMVLVTAEPDRSGNVICNGTSDETDIIRAFTYLTSGRTWRETVKLIGDFTIDGTILVPGYTVLDLTEANIFLANTSNCNMINLNGAYINVIGGTLDGNGGNQAAASHGIEFTANNAYIENLVWNTEVKNCRDYGIWLHGNSATNFQHRVKNCVIHDNQYGITVEQWHALIEGNAIYSNTRVAIYAVSGNGRVYANNHISYNGTGNWGAFHNQFHEDAIVGNTISFNNIGIVLSNNCVGTGITGNLIYGNSKEGIRHELDQSVRRILIEGNVFRDNSISSGLGFPHILIQNNAEDWQINDNQIVNANDTDYTDIGVEITAGALRTIVKDNFFKDNPTACVSDGGTDSIFNSKPFQFTDVTGGTAVVQVASPTGCYVSDAEGTAIAWGQIPSDVYQVMQLKVWAVAKDAPVAAGGQMHCEFTFNAGASNENYATAAKSWNVINKDSVEADYVADDVVHWLLKDADTGDSEISALAPGDSFEILAIYESSADPDGDTDAKFRIIEVEYV